MGDESDPEEQVRLPFQPRSRDSLLFSAAAAWPAASFTSTLLQLLRLRAEITILNEDIIALKADNELLREWSDMKEEAEEEEHYKQEDYDYRGMRAAEDDPDHVSCRTADCRCCCRPNNCHCCCCCAAACASLLILC